MKVLEDDLLLVDFSHGDILDFLFFINSLAFLVILKTGRRRFFDGEVSDDGFVSLGLDFAVLGVSFGGKFDVVFVSGMEIQS